MKNRIFFFGKNCTDCSFCLKEGLNLSLQPGAKFKLKIQDRKKIKKGIFDFLYQGQSIACYHNMFDEAMDGADKEKIRRDILKTKCHLFYDYKKAPETATFSAVQKLKEYEENRNRKILYIITRPIFWIVTIILMIFSAFIDNFVEKNYFNQQSILRKDILNVKQSNSTPLNQTPKTHDQK